MSESLIRGTILDLAIAKQVGTHEATIPANLAEIDYTHGWKETPVAIGAPEFPHLQDDLLDKLGAGIYLVESMEYGDFGILDGHHRRSAIERDGLTFVISQLFPLIANHPYMKIGVWPDSAYKGAPYSPQEISKFFRNRDEVVLAKATKFQIVGKDGVTRRIKEVQPEVLAPREVLAGKKR
jgi:hypothetical protein